MGRIVSLIEYREKVRRVLEDSLPIDVVERGRRDPHSSRAPRPCGITIHTGVGCSNMCLYCYIYDMGFPATVKEYPLPPEGIVYALSLNPYIAPGRSLAAYGSVTEPLHPVIRSFSLKLMELVYRYLRLLSQISTKSILDRETVDSIVGTDPRCSVLVTIVAIDSAKMLEPRAPDPIDRIVYAGYASRYLHTSLFIRPTIPTVTDAEADKIFRLAVEHGVKHIVLGSLRITRSILAKFQQISPALYREVIRRAPREPRGREQVAIRERDIKEKLASKAGEYQLKVYTSACQANIDAHSEYCNMCREGPCGNVERMMAVDEGDVVEFLEYSGIRYGRVDVSGDAIAIEVRGRVDRGRIEYIKRFIEQVARTMVRVNMV